jgi:hypothetical protein
VLGKRLRRLQEQAADDRLVPVEIAFREVRPSMQAERELHRRLRRLARSFPELTGCHVLVEPDAADGRGPYRVRIDLTVPRGRLGVEGYPPAAAARHDLSCWIRDAFARAREELSAGRRHREARPATRLF